MTDGCLVNGIACWLIVVLPHLITILQLKFFWPKARRTLNLEGFEALGG